MPSTYALTVNGVARTIHLPSLDFQFVSNGRDYLRVTVISIAAAYRPTLGHEVILTEDGTDIFGGVIAKTTETGIDGLPVDDIATEITCDAFNVYADKVFVTETFAAGETLEDILTVLVANYLTDFGVTLHASQATGPTFTQALEFHGESLSSVLQTLTELAEDAGTGESWLWEIDPAKVFQMYEAGSVAAPIDFVSPDKHEHGDITVIRSRDKYANRVVVKVGDSRVITLTETFTANGGATASYTTQWLGVQSPNSVWPNSLIVNGVGQGPVGWGNNGSVWYWDFATHTLIHLGGGFVPANGDTITVNYDVPFPQTITVEDAGEVAANGPHEVVLSYPNVFDFATATALATAALAKLLTPVTEVSIPTYEPGLLPGQTTTVTHALRNVNADFLITEVRARSTAVGLLRTIRAVSGDVFRGSYRDVYRAWLGGGTGGTATAGTGPSVSVGGNVPGAPEQSVQFNEDGVFTGDAKFLWKGTRTYSGFPANLTVQVEDESRYNMALVGPTATSDYWLAQVFGGGDIFWTLGRDWTVQPLRDYTVSAAREIIMETGSNFADQFHVRALASAWGLALGAVRTVATTYEIDVTGATPITTIYAVPTTADTNIVFPSLTTAAANPATGQHRVLITRHDSTSNTVRLRPKTTSELINDTSEYVMTPRETVIWQGLTGTGAGWKPVARFTT